ncbi:MAG: glycoside hydrolase, partial [bacterium]|nr:glycoside hydrolase [bacterium]
AVMNLPAAESEAKPIIKSDEFDIDDASVSKTASDTDQSAERPGQDDGREGKLDLVWQWNHNPDNDNWSLTARRGWLRLATGEKASGILHARNTLTQRTYGPTCSGEIKIDVSNMNIGDVAGLAAFSYNYGYIAVTKENSSMKLVMVDASSNAAKGKDDPQVIAAADCTGSIVYLKEDFNFAGEADGANKDTVSFYYSFDGSNWTKLGNTIQLSYELTHFMGSRFALFNYATRSAGGYVDFDYFRVSDEITGD